MTAAGGSRPGRKGVHSRLRTALVPQVRVRATMLLLFLTAAAGMACPAWSSDGIARPVPPRVVAVIPEDFPPTYFREDSTGKPAGFAVDVLNAIARRAGIEVSYSFGRGWADITRRVLSKEADIIPGLGISEDRKKDFAFTEPVEVFPISIFTRTQNYRVTGIAAGLTVAVVEDSIAYDKVKQHPGVRISAYKSFQQALFDLLAGHVDAFVCPAPTLLQMARDAGVDDQIKAVGDPVAEIKRGIALRKDDTALLERLNPVIGSFVGSPEYQEIYTKWYGRARPFWTPVRVVAAAGGFAFYTVLLMAWWRYWSVLRLNERLRDTIAERKRAEEFITRIFESMGEGLAVLDRDYRILTANKAFSRIFAPPDADILGKGCREVLHRASPPCVEAGSLCPAQPAFETGRPHVGLHTYHDASGTPMYLEVKTYPMPDESGTVASVIQLYMDMTEKLRLEEQLRHAQKMEAVGQLAGGIAHDFNNILTAIIGYANILQMKLDPGSPLGADVESILASAERAAGLTQSLLAFSRKQAIHTRPVKLNEIIRRVQTLLALIIGEDIELVTTLAGENLAALADGTQVEQVLMNLAAKARDAMPQGGRLTIETRCVALNFDFTKTHGYGEPGE